MRSLTPWIALVLALSCGLLWREANDGFLRAADLAFGAWVAREGGRPVSEASVTLVEGDPVTDREEVGQPPAHGSPMDYTLIFKETLLRTPSVIAVGPVLMWPEPAPAYLPALVEYARRAPALLLGTLLGRAEEPEEEPARLPVIGAVRGDLSRIPEFSAVIVHPVDVLRDAGTPGVLNLPNHAAARSGWVPLVVRYRGDLVPTLPLLAGIHWAGVTLAEVAVEPGREIRIGKSWRIPIDATGAALLEPSARAAVRRTDRSALLVAAETGDRSGPPFPGDAVVFGPGPVPDPAPGTLTAAQAAATIAGLQTGHFLRELRGAEVWIPAGLLMGSGFLFFSFSRPAALLVWTGLVAGYAQIAIGLARAQGLALPATLPIGGLTVLLVLRWLAGRSGSTE